MKFTAKIIFAFIFPVIVLLVAFFWYDKNEVIRFRQQHSGLYNAQNSTACVHSAYKPQKSINEQPAPTDCFFIAFGTTTIKELDSPTCRRISQYVVVDTNHVYKQLFDPGSSDSPEYILVKQANAKTFTWLGNSFYRDATHLFYDAGKSMVSIPHIDLATLQILSSNYFKDKNGIYTVVFSYSGPATKIVVSKVNGFDVPTFTVVLNDQNQDDMYFKDKNGIYSYADDGKLVSDIPKISGADTSTFKLLNQYGIAADKNHVYAYGTPVASADPKTFEVLSGTYFKDSARVYTVVGGFLEVPGRDACSFEVVGEQYSKDKNHVYYQDAVVENADPATFKVAGEHAFDKNYDFKGVYGYKR